MAWTDQLRKEAIDLWNDGASATQIAKALGHSLTRNAVTGVVSRAGLQRAAPRRPITPMRLNAEGTSGTRAPRRQPRRWAHGTQEPEARRHEDGSSIGTFDLAVGDCRWPHGEVGSASFHYCANAVTDGSPYCEHHTARAWRKAGEDR